MGIENQGEFNRSVIDQKIEERKFGQLSPEQIEKITQRLPKESSILEIGSYDGILLKQLKDSGNEYLLTGGDRLFESAGFIKEKVPEAKFIELDITKNEIPEKFDVIFMKFTLGCLPLVRELELKRYLSLQEKEELWDKVLAKVKNNCRQFVLITQILKEGINAEDVNRPIFIPNDTLQKLLDKHFKNKKLLESQEEGPVFNIEIYLLSEPKID